MCPPYVQFHASHLTWKVTGSWCSTRECPCVLSMYSTFYHYGDLLYMTHPYISILYKNCMYVCLYRSYYCMLLVWPKPGCNAAWYRCCKMKTQKMHRLVVMVVVILVNKSHLQLHLQYMFLVGTKLPFYIECKSVT